MPKKKDPNNLIKKVCAELGITQKELAERMGIAEQTIHNWSSQGNVPEWAIKFFDLLQKEHARDEMEKCLLKVTEYLVDRLKISR